MQISLLRGLLAWTKRTAVLAAKAKHNICQEHGSDH